MSTAIRQLYNPIQPTVKESVNDVIYREFLPTLKLQPFIYCYWELKTTRKLSNPFNYRVVADGCMDIFFDLRNPQDNFVMGFCERSVEFPLNKTFHYVGIRFLPGMFPQIFNVSASELSNRVVELRNINAKISMFITNLFSSLKSGEQIRKLFDQFFMQYLSKEEFDSDNRIYNAIHIILKDANILKIESGLNIGISLRQLRRLFKFYIGDTPKTFTNVIRFQKLLDTVSSSQDLRKNKRYFDAGYYDQAHFIKEFKKFYGLTPGQAFNK